MLIIQHRNIFYAIAGTMVGLSIFAVLFFGLNFGIDFTGGTLTEMRFEQDTPALGEIEDALDNIGLLGYSLRSAGEEGYILRAGNLSEEQREALPEVLSLGGAYPVSIERFTEIGPTVGEELRNKALIAIGLVIIAIVLYIAFAFRTVSVNVSSKAKGVSSWTYGGLAIVALLHDIIIPLGLIVILGHFFASQIDTLFVMALLAVLGYSVNDTIVIFDRVRENLRMNLDRGKVEDFAQTVGRSLYQTYARSINTSLTTLLVLGALFFFGPEAMRDFALVLIVGVIAGSYSSLALATPLLVTVEEWRSKRV